jgi:secreted trypsin-like serine protease
MVSRFSTLFACCLLVGCGAVPDQEGTGLGEGDQTIIGGATDNGDPSVVALFAHARGATSGSLCTATVIAPTKVLTAAHCVDPRVVGSGNVFEVLTGTSLSGAPRLAVSRTAFDPAFNPNNLVGGHDIAVVTLAQRTSLAPLPINRTALGNANLGIPVRLVGYGTNTHGNTGAGTKRTVTTRLDDFSNLLAHIGNSGQQTCHGDSGGPAFQVLNGVERIIGVTSFGSDFSATQVCFQGGQDTRVDRMLSFIDGQM